VNGVLLKEPTLLHDGDVIRIVTTIVIRYTTNPQMFMSKKTTSSLRHPDEVKEPTRIRRTQSSVPPSLADTPLSPSLVGPGIEPGALIDHILLVYARHEWEALVAPIVDRLYNLEIPVWVDQYLAPGGDDWKLALAQARSECWLLIVIVTQASMELEYIQKIWRHFHNREKSVIMVMVDDVDRLPIGANVAYKISYNPAQIEATLRQIVSAIKQLE
jgi:hypothetical protein